MNSGRVYGFRVNTKPDTLQVVFLLARRKSSGGVVSPLGVSGPVGPGRKVQNTLETGRFFHKFLHSRKCESEILEYLQ
jgi:hypothetical protein